MKKLTKKQNLFKTFLNHTKKYDIDEGITLLKKMATSKFIESLDVAINLGINPKNTNQNIRNTTILPHGIGRLIKVAVFTQGENEKIAKKFGAEFVGLHNLIETVKTKTILFDVAIATPDVMPYVSQLGPILGPRGLMPNPKLGTITEKLEYAIKNAKSGQIHYKNDKNGIIHISIGKINFENTKIKENLNALISSLKQSKPSQSKGTYIKQVVISTTMSSGIKIDLNTLNNAS
ncbi:50S ribosomal protein L1 [Buchnera aphidicola str. Bp (Baizongia pistaciae)]|uniref:Large ribosomal subunit protein uL1 n=1 Tax=Buchnera aphidicola subsp. Baizongia pistaciae (strain Bp) TaxID=224915 RepID=RL1_BUCBP|nr:50S ribosomal protein L1 [Buchnera aphidicola]Q89B17.1 RecName: Full=Large ribosomal subunit protein uL1; AltName: Full=50S ribosomal protein L1 [Buchnera aphidicola str. Bp (Baizongia pistaciae)]AAO26781.1 50S ribosomal protein L1 [Buchnera aphidicola str. Bp (Baizongia pistaciae)]